jgi:hypothetical protein
VKKNKGKFIAVGILLPLLMGLVAFLFSSPASAATACHGTQTATITNDPDSGNFGNWAVDTTFTRTTTVLASCSGVVLEDTGSFQTVAGGKSPRSGVALPSTKIDGTFTGRITLTFKAPETQSQITALLKTLPKHVNKPASSVTGQWADALSATEDNDWKWTYTTGCQTWVDAFNNSDGKDSKGDITKVCPVTTTTSNPPPSSTAPTGASNPPASAQNSASGSGSVVHQVSTVPVGAPATGGGATARVDGSWYAYGTWALAVIAIGLLIYRKEIKQFRNRKASREG